jgi:hypothetical protein
LNRAALSVAAFGGNLYYNYIDFTMSILAMFYARSAWAEKRDKLEQEVKLKQEKEEEKWNKQWEERQKSKLQSNQSPSDNKT